MEEVTLKHAPEFSIIIPAYNAEKFIQSAVKSVQDQSTNDWELIIIENGSTDRTTIICEEYLSDKRITLLHSEKGVSNARNAGIQAARGKWLVFLDADDQLLKDTLEKYKEIDEKYSPDMIIGEYEEKCKEYNGDMQIYQGGTLKDFLRISLENPTQKCNTKAVAFLNTKVQYHGIFFDKDIAYAEDSVFFLETFSHADKVVDVNYPVYRVIYHPASAVRSGKKRLEKEYLPAINKVHDIVKEYQPDFENEQYVFVLNQLLVVLVNDVFARKESVFQQLHDARGVMNIHEYREAIEGVDLSELHGAKKAVFLMMKKNALVGICLAAKVRQQQNKKKVNALYV